MNSKLQKRRGILARCSIVGQVLFVVLSIPIFLGLVIAIAALSVHGIDEYYTVTWWLNRIAYAIVITLIWFLEFSFLRSLSSEDPFSRRQINKLLVVAVLFTVRALLLMHQKPLLENIQVINQPFPMGLSADADTHAINIRLDNLLDAVFILCVAAALNYGGALKEDSDSML